MSFQFVSAEAWAEFYEQFPGAVAFLTYESLVGELRFLRDRRAGDLLNSWQEGRLKELEEWERSRAAMLGECELSF